MGGFSTFALFMHFQLSAIMPVAMEALLKYRPQFAHAARVTAAALAAFAVNLEFNFQQGIWIAFTAILVVQSSVGASVRAAFERMTGTLSGAAYGALIGSVMPHDTTAGLALTVLVGLGPAAFAASLSPNFRIAPITVAILLFSNVSHSMTPVEFAEHRVAEIALGCVIGLAVSLIVFPSRAHVVLAEAAGAVLKQYTELFDVLVGMAAEAKDWSPVDDHHNQLRKAIAKLDTVGDEAKRERATYLTGEPDPEPLLRMVRRIRNDLVMVGRAVVQPLPGAARPALVGPLTEVSSATGAALRAIADALPGNKTIIPSRSLDAAFENFSLATSALHQKHSLDALAEGEVGRIFTLGFALEQLRQNLQDLTARANEFIRDEGAKT
jgi:uncharacterized membrane protein YccC